MVLKRTVFPFNPSAERLRGTSSTYKTEYPSKLLLVQLVRPGGTPHTGGMRQTECRDYPRKRQGKLLGKTQRRHSRKCDSVSQLVACGACEEICYFRSGLE